MKKLGQATGILLFSTSLSIDRALDRNVGGFVMGKGIGEAGRQGGHGGFLHKQKVVEKT